VNVNVNVIRKRELKECGFGFLFNLECSFPLVEDAESHQLIPLSVLYRLSRSEQRSRREAAAKVAALLAAFDGSIVSL
jgi:hypothetical protein